ncbi:hypothetical protein [Streptomyces sp. NPDC004065]|uniref:hypothetical protein n=1 Tax=Streptomyces sp. NPDC004065 TaxID=3364689 RepID=UPI00384C72CA
MDAERITAKLYTVHPTAFAAARAAWVAEALNAQEPALAAEIAALKRPSLSAWASNLLVHSEPRQAARLLRLGEDLRRAHREPHPDRARLTRLNRRRRTLVGTLTERAYALSAEAGHPIGQAARRKVEETLYAALADPSAAGRWAAGRLVRALPPPTALTPPAPAPEPPARPGGRRARPRRTARTAEQRARLRQQEHERARAEVERTEAALRALEQRATELAQQLHATAELRRRVRDDLDRARDRAARTERAAQEARRAAERARDRTDTPT